MENDSALCCSFPASGPWHLRQTSWPGRPCAGRVLSACSEETELTREVTLSLKPRTANTPEMKRHSLGATGVQSSSPNSRMWERDGKLLCSPAYECPGAAPPSPQSFFFKKATLPLGTSHPRSPLVLEEDSGDASHRAPETAARPTESPYKLTRFPLCIRTAPSGWPKELTSGIYWIAGCSM